MLEKRAVNHVCPISLKTSSYTLHSPLYPLVSKDSKNAMYGNGSWFCLAPRRITSRYIGEGLVSNVLWTEFGWAMYVRQLWAVPSIAVISTSMGLYFASCLKSKNQQCKETLNVARQANLCLKCVNNEYCVINSQTTLYVIGGVWFVRLYGKIIHVC